MIIRSRNFLILIATVSALLVAGCGGTGLDQKSGTASHNPGSRQSVEVPRNDPAVNYQDPAAVCEAFARVISMTDTTTDSDPDDVYDRARPYVTYEHYQQLRQRPRTRTGIEWETWKHHKAKAEVRLHPFAGDSEITQSQRAHSVLVDVTPVGPDGWRGSISKRTVHCGLNTQDGQWRVAASDVEELPVS